MTERAILLHDLDSAEVANAAKLLRFFGVESKTVSLDEFLRCLSKSGTNDIKSAIGGRVICSTDVLERLIQTIDQSADLLCWWKEQVHSVFVYSGADLQTSEHLLRLLGQDGTLVDELPSGCIDFKVTDQLDGLCGAMAGVHGTASTAGVLGCHVLRTSNEPAIDLISTAHGALFLKLTWHNVPIFLSTSRSIIDVDSILPNGVFDIRDHVASALPIVFYVKWALPGAFSGPGETNACLVIDDPLLKSNHGFVNFYDLLRRMQQHRFSTSVAFIPWNSSRSEPEVTKLFRDNPTYYSISVHGCDHGRAEFGSADSLQLYSKARQALERMSNHELATGLGYDRVMVFPQGVFSKAAVTALKHAGFIAAANNDTIDVGPDPGKIRIRDFWETAVMAYGGFPIFTRRYPSEGIENFAFDAVLGKPAIAAIHHDDCSDGYERIGNFIDRLNRLDCSITWRTLAEVVRRSFRQKRVAGDSIEVEMYATELLLENNTNRSVRYFIHRRETESSIVEEIRTEGERIGWKQDTDRVFFDIHLQPGEKTTISIRFRDLGTKGAYEESLLYRAKILARRHLCELRDNYFVTSKHRITDLFGTRGQPPSRKATAGQGDQRAAVEQVLRDFVDWLSRYGETSHDHQSFFAGPIGGRAKSLYYRNRLIGTAAVAPMIFAEAFVPSARRLFHHPSRFPIADAHYAMGFTLLYETSATKVYLERAIHFLDELKKSRCPGFEEYCWGYPFDWVWRGGVIKRQTPLITTTPYCFEAFLRVTKLLESDVRDQRSEIRTDLLGEYEQILKSIARHAAHDIKDFKTSETASSCSYTPGDEGGVINAAAYRAFLLTSASQVFSNDSYWRIAERNLNFVLENQNQDGSWFYAVDGVRDFVDHYHTCFVMKALSKIHTLTGNDRCLAALSRGVDYYLENLFADDGLPKPFAKAPRLTVYKRELYDSAECINLCLLLRDRFPELERVLEKVVRGILKNWIKPDGSFRSRRLHFGWDNVPMHRWGQSQMFRALAFYLREAAKTEKLKSETLKSEDGRPKTEGGLPQIVSKQSSVRSHPSSVLSSR
jgi:hypothetical protein